MKTVYVTETGSISKDGHFRSNGVIGVDKEAWTAISYIADRKALAINRRNESHMREITYRIENTSIGYRLSLHKLY